LGRSSGPDVASFPKFLADFSAIPFTASDSFISYNVCDYRDNPDVPFLSGTRDHIEMRDLEIRVIRILMLVLH